MASWAVGALQAAGLAVGVVSNAEGVEAALGVPARPDLEVGLGPIGLEVARLGQAFGMHVVGFRRSPRGDEPCRGSRPPRCWLRFGASCPRRSRRRATSLGSLSLRLWDR